MKIVDMPNVPEMDEVPGCESVVITLSKMPCGVCYETVFLDVDGKMLQQHQHAVVDKMPPLFHQEPPPLFGAPPS